MQDKIDKFEFQILIFFLAKYSNILNLLLKWCKTIYDTVLYVYDLDNIYQESRRTFLVSCIHSNFISNSKIHPSHFKIFHKSKFHKQVKNTTPYSSS